MRITKALLAGGAAATLLALPSQAAASYTPGEYKGHNSQGGKMILRAAPGKIERFGQQVKIKCRVDGRVVDRETGRFTSRRPIQVGRSGRFSAKRKGRYNVVMRGRVTGNSASGKFRVSFKRGRARCSSPTVTWTARWFVPL